MSDFIGRIPVPALPSSGLTFPFTTEFGYGYSQQFPVVTHRFGELDAKAEQRFQTGIGPQKYIFRRSHLSLFNRNTLATFWEAIQGSYQTFLYNVPNADQSFTSTRVIWDQLPLSFDYLVNACSVGMSFVAVPDPASAPSYSISSTCTRFPSTTMATALTGQVQQIIPLIHIRVRESAVSDIYLSDRRCTVGGQVYLPRVMGLGEQGSDVILSQDIKGSADNVTFQFGNADQAMTNLANDTDLKYAQIDLCLYHINSGILLQLWSGFIQTFTVDGSPVFTVQASDGIFQINQSYPTRTISRTCYKTYNDGLLCPWATQGASSGAVTAAGGDPASCDYNWNSANGCLVHGMADWFGAMPILPQSVSIKDNSTGFMGFDRNTVTATSIISDTIWGKALPEIWCNMGSSAVFAFYVNCQIAAVRDNGDYFDVFGIVGLGPLGFALASGYSGLFVTNADGYNYLVAPLADGYPPIGLKISSSGTSAVGNTAQGLRFVPGYTNISTMGDQSYNQFALAQVSGGQTYSVGGSAASLPFSPEICFCEVLYQKPSGINPTATDSHSMSVPIAQGLTGWTWDIFDNRIPVVGLIDPFWIAINTFLRALGMQNASPSVQEALFVREAINKGDGTGCAEIADTLVTPLVGSGTELQFQFQGIIDTQKPLRDWLTEILNCGLGYFTWEFGRLKLGCRINASAVDAYTLGSIKFQSLKLMPIDAAFEHLVVDFADVEYQYQANTVEYQDKTHAAYYGRAGAPLTSRMHSLGAPSLSQNLRLAATRTREELGSVTPAEWRNARVATWETTLLGLGNEVGQVVSITDPVKMPGLRGICNVDGSGNVTWVSGDLFDLSMQNKQIVINGVQYTVTTLTGSPVPTSFTCTPGAAAGSGVAFKVVTMDFRIQSWQLRKDWSIAMTAKTVTPSMYNLDVGPMPADVIAQTPPVLAFAPTLGPAWGPGQDTVASDNGMYAGEQTFSVAQDYSTDTATGTSSVNLLIQGASPCNSFSPVSAIGPFIGAVSQATTGGTIPGGSILRVSLCAIDANGLPTLASAIAYITVPTGTNTNTVTLSNVQWPAVSGLVSFCVFAGVTDTLISLQQTGALTATGGGTAYTPSSVTLNSVGTRGGLALPDSGTTGLRAKVKIGLVPGPTWGVITAITPGSGGTGTVTCLDMIDTISGAGLHGHPSFTPVGRVLSVVGRPTTTAYAPLWSSVVTSWNSATGEMGCAATVSSGVVELGDQVVIRTLGVDNSANPTQIQDLGVYNANTGYVGMEVNAYVGATLRVMDGTGRGAIRQIVSNTADTVVYDTAVLMDATSVWTIEHSSWVYLGDSTTVQSSLLSSQVTLSVPIDNLLNTLMIISVFTVDSDGIESPDGDQPVREVWVFGQELGLKNISTTPYALLAEDEVLTFLNGASVVNLPPADTVIRNTIWLNNATTSTVLTINAAAGDTIEGGASITLSAGVTYQIMPNV